MTRNLLPLITLFCIFSCQTKQKADLIVYNATIYTIDSTFSTVGAMAIKDGKIIATGAYALLDEQFEAREKLDAVGKYIYPGFLDAHAHFVGYASSLQRVNLSGTESWAEVIQRTKEFAEKNPAQSDTSASWILGRGWDQNDWQHKEFPTNEELNALFPNRPVLLTRIDGHAAVANEAALKLAGIRPGDKLAGGDIETKNGRLTGILIDNATDIISSKIPPSGNSQFIKSLLDAQQNCFAVGLTTIDDCGLDYKDVEAIRSMQDEGTLKMRLYVMLSDNKANFDYLARKGIIKTERLNVRSIKVYADGALGSRGASLLQPYADRPGWSGFLLSPLSHFDSIANYIHQQGWQMCTHAIGDSGNRTILGIYGKYLKGKNDLRWRIEHAQVVNAKDFDLFGAASIIPSVQPTHATSDMYWAGDRLGPERVKGAYAYQQLLQQNGWIPLGTDFPVEDISPFRTFYAAVIRKDASGYPAGGYQVSNALDRKEALRGMTIWAARANFEEKEKGSLEKGKFADFIILDRDLLQAPATELTGAKVLMTFIGGEKVFDERTGRPR